MRSTVVAQVSPSSATFTIGELAQEFDLTTRAIRFYEEGGLLCPTRSGRQRVYSARDRTRLRLTLRGKRMGLTLAEVKELVDMYESPQDTQPQLQHLLAVLARHREQLEGQIGDLQTTLDEVRAREREARALLTAGPPTKPARRKPAASSATSPVRSKERP
ncbi:MAG: hypothetical protein RLZZ618_1402 [Pseudomonadota bacterium]|jgi:DNA-binding transcriptional MerR regulator